MAAFPLTPFAKELKMSQEDRRMQANGSGIRRSDGTGLVLTDNMIAGHQAAHLLAWALGSKMQVLRRDKPAYRLISEGHVDVVVADIDHAELGGLALLAHTKRHWPAVTTYALTGNEDAYIKQLAQGMGGCRGFFYLSEGRPGLDMRHGLAARISAQMARERRHRPDPLPQPSPMIGDETPALFAMLNRNRFSKEAPD